MTTWQRTRPGQSPKARISGSPTSLLGWPAPSKASTSRSRPLRSLEAIREAGSPSRRIKPLGSLRRSGPGPEDGCETHRQRNRHPGLKLQTKNRAVLDQKMQRRLRRIFNRQVIAKNYALAGEKYILFLFSAGRGLRESHGVSTAHRTDQSIEPNPGLPERGQVVAGLRDRPGRRRFHRRQEILRPRDGLWRRQQTHRGPGLELHPARKASTLSCDGGLTHRRRIHHLLTSSSSRSGTGRN